DEHICWRSSGHDLWGCTTSAARRMCSAVRNSRHRRPPLSATHCCPTRCCSMRELTESASALWRGIDDEHHAVPMLCLLGTAIGIWHVYGPLRADSPAEWPASPSGCLPKWDTNGTFASRPPFERPVNHGS